MSLWCVYLQTATFNDSVIDSYAYSFIHLCVHSSIHTDSAYMHSDVHSNMHLTCISTRNLARIPTCIPKRIQTCFHTWICHSFTRHSLQWHRRILNLFLEWIGPELQLHAIVTSVRYRRNYALTRKNFFLEERERSRGRYPLIFDPFRPWMIKNKNLA